MDLRQSPRCQWQDGRKSQPTLALSSSAVASMITRLALLVTMASKSWLPQTLRRKPRSFQQSWPMADWPWWQSSACSFRRLAWWSDQPMSYHHSLPTLIKHMSTYVYMVVGAYRETSCGSWIRSDDFAGWSDRKRLGWLGQLHSISFACIREWTRRAGARGFLGSGWIYRRRKRGGLQATSRHRDQAWSHFDVGHHGIHHPSDLDLLKLRLKLFKIISVSVKIMFC